MGGSNSKAKKRRILGTHREGLMEKGKRSWCHCLSQRADILETQLLSLLGGVSATTSKVLQNSGCRVCWLPGHGLVRAGYLLLTN